VLRGAGKRGLRFCIGFGSLGLALCLIYLFFVTIIAVNWMFCLGWIGCFDFCVAFVTFSIPEEFRVSFVCTFFVTTVEAFFWYREVLLFVEFEFGFCCAEVLVARGTGEIFFVG